jgi:hypothetical protein
MLNFFNRSRLFEEAVGDPGGGGGGADKPVLDAKAIQTLIDTSLNGYATKTNKTLDGFKTQFDGLMTRLDGLKAAPKADDPHDPNAGGDVPVPPAIKALLDKSERERVVLETRLGGVEKARQESEARAETTDRESKVRAALGKIRFATPEDAETVYDVVASKVKRDDDGNLIVGDTTMDAYLTAYLDKRPKMLAAENTGGSGNGAGAGRPGKVDLNSELKTPQQKADFLKEIQRVALAR